MQRRDPKPPPPPTPPASDELVLAAVERAVRHQPHAIGSAPAARACGVPVWTILEHLQLARRSAQARHVRARLAALLADGALESERRHGVQTWGLAAEGEQRLRSARRGGQLPALPESPQHRAWRNARALAAQEIERLRGEVELCCERARALLGAEAPAPSDAWLELAERASRALKMLASASHCLYEWAEPDEARADVDERVESSDAALSEDARRRVQARRAGRRNIRLWRGEQSP
ncbi:MAG TPA: hypothetical protein VL979_12070 [Solirubrobacteraceae bacterium]|nr:hypothetical protein [Solirubrobacteraceae bacterium]